MWLTTFLPGQTRKKLRLLLLDDPVLVSFPKSGRTWVRVMMNELGVPLLLDHAGARGRGTTDTSLHSKKRVVLLIRDPRDTVVSFYHHSRTRVAQKYLGTMSEFVRDPEHGIERIVQFNCTWLATDPSSRRFTMLEYENLRRNTESEMRRILNFIGKRKVSDAALRAAVSESSFEKLRKVEAAESASHLGKSLKPGDVSDPSSYKVRKGKVGGYREELSEHDIGFCDEVMTRCGYAEAVAECRRRTGAPSPVAPTSDSHYPTH